MPSSKALAEYRFDGYESKNFIDGKWTPPHSKRTMTVRNPKDNSVITELHPISDQEDVDNAVKIAQEAFKGPWSSFTGAKRAALINKLADLIDENAEQLAFYESICAGRLISQLKYEVPWIADVFRYYAGWCDKLEGESFTDDDGFYKIIRHEPIGVCAGITPWNGGLFVLALKAAPALAVGNTFILKPPEKSPLSSLFATTLFEKAGFPPGVFQVVTGDGSTGALIAGHERIEKVSFTGSIKIGQIIQNLANNSNMKRVTLELGGKSPALVFDDCDLEQTVQWLSRGITQNAGQNCTCSSRIYVQKGIAKKFLDGMKARLEEIGATIGSDPQDESTIFGPVVDKAQFDNVYRFIESGKEQATLLTGGYKYDKTGFYVPPTLFVDPKPDALIYKEEIFGPVGCVRVFEKEEEVIEWANDSHYGLAAYLFSENIERMFRVTKQLRAGTVGVNAISQLFPQAPFGGYKKSGLGREMGKYALLDFTEPKTIFIRTKRF